MKAEMKELKQLVVLITSDQKISICRLKVSPESYQD
jgi:hypothetical protein